MLTSKSLKTIPARTALPLLSLFPIYPRSLPKPNRTFAKTTTSHVAELENALLKVKITDKEPINPSNRSIEFQIIQFLEKSWVSKKINMYQFMSLKKELKLHRELYLNGELKDIINSEKEVFIMNKLGMLLRGGTYRCINLSSNDITGLGAWAFADGLTVDFTCEELSLAHNSIKQTHSYDYSEMVVGFNKLNLGRINLNGNKLEAEELQLWESCRARRPLMIIYEDPIVAESSVAISKMKLK